MVIKKRRSTPTKSRKNRRTVQHPNKVYLRQINATLNRKLKSIQHHLVVQQSDLQQHLMKIIQDGKEQTVESKDSRAVSDSPRVQYKQLNVLLITPAMERESSANSILIEQSLRHLVQHVNEIKTIQPVADHTSGQQLDLILVLHGEDVLSNQNLEAMSASSAKKAIWLSDQSDLKQMESIIPFFDYVFTPNSADIPSDQHMGNVSCHELPFPPNPTVFCPQVVGREYESDVYIIGDAHPGSCLYALANHAWLWDKKVRVEGEGWKDFGAFVPVQPHELREKLYNGSKLVVQDNSSARRIMEVAACGTFQLVSAASSGPENTDAFKRYATIEELVQKLGHYWDHVEQRRLAASQALSYMKYNQSYLHKCLQLMDIIFQ
ncbi:glycosyltransferase family 1 protein [Paenibacillus taichungensis]|uniref:Glycosyltransferase family 1 protein n=1 Tax=Paenibacillus taichungensis TaxID=484184 RepID=A0ABX2MR15_9BACL|nr:glycosyltransferase family 1 protein [Paenibacillus taichungensis]